MAHSGLCQIIFVGTGSLNAATNRAQTSILLSVANRNILFDAGDGTADRLRRLNISRIDYIAVSEVSALTLSGLSAVAEWVRHNRQPVPVVLGPPGTRIALEAITSISDTPTQELFSARELISPEFVELAPGEYLEAIAMDRGEKNALGFLFHEAALPGRIDAAAGARLGLSGADFAKIQAGERVRNVDPREVMGPPRPGRRIVIGTHGRATTELRSALSLSDVSILGTPFMDERRQLALESFMLTGWEAAELYRDEGVKLGVGIQLGPYAPTWIQVAEARQFFRDFYAPSDGDRLEVPLPSNGSPEFVRGQRPGEAPRRAIATKKRRAGSSDKG